MPGAPTDLTARREAIRAAYLADEDAAVDACIECASLGADEGAAISAHAAELTRRTRAAAGTHILDSFLLEYDLSTREGVALMCLAEALLRVPDEETIDALIEDKISPSDWGTHLGRSSSSLVNASTWALLVTGKVLADDGDEAGVVGALRALVKRLGEPVIRVAVAQVMRELGEHFVLGPDLGQALRRAGSMEARGFTYSYDMLGEAARTDADARRYHLAYADAITRLGEGPREGGIRDRPGISVKLSALHPRYEYAQRDRVMDELAPRLRALVLLAASAGIGLNIDAEEADRLELSLDIVEALLREPALRGWDGLGVVVQAYGRRALPVLDYLHALARASERRIMVRLVKGAYWDTEIKRAQVLGLADYPVFTRKASTDVSFLACARKLLGMTDCIYPQFATHNAHSVAAVLAMAPDPDGFEFQRLHGMGEALHGVVAREHGTRCRIYAPVGAHEDLLAYLVRRLLENGANSSFVNQLLDESVSPQEIARDPIDAVRTAARARPIPLPADLYGPGRRNARGWDLTDALTVAELERSRERYRDTRWEAGPMVSFPYRGAPARAVRNPARPEETVGTVVDADPGDVASAVSAAVDGARRWGGLAAETRACRIARVGDLLEDNAPELFALACREAGKTWADCIGEVREAVDFARYYASQARRHGDALRPRGVIACISPWNFPLAIFCGQILGALAAGNAVLAKPSEQTPLIAARAVGLMREAGIPADALALLPGEGAVVGAALTGDPRVAGVCFTGSTETGRAINRAMAERLAPEACLIAETGGLNAMVVDSSALPEQAVRDIVTSAFQSAGQRCSALRMLYVQEEVAGRILPMLEGAMRELRLGDPWAVSTDIGPVIDADARARIDAYCRAADAEGRVLVGGAVPPAGHFVCPTVIRVSGIEALEEEIFGPVLHVATFGADELDDVIEAINAAGYGLTFGLHTRIDDRVQHVVDRVLAGNIYINRNQIGAVVGSQPFGGMRLSGTGPKAGGPGYVARLAGPGTPPDGPPPAGPPVSAARLQSALDEVKPAAARPCGDGWLEPVDFPGPTGESNRMSFIARGVVLCLGPGHAAVHDQVRDAARAGNAVVAMTGEGPVGESAGESVRFLPGRVDPADLASLRGLDAVASRADPETQRRLVRALASRGGAIVPLIDELGVPHRYALERHLCIDTTAAGGNADLLARAGT